MLLLKQILQCGQKIDFLKKSISHLAINKFYFTAVNLSILFLTGVSVRR